MMKLVIDERVKHRIIGLAVILSIGAIFAPAIMKKSNQRFDGNVSVSVELPAKPTQPDIALTEKKAMFEAVRVAHVELPDVQNEQPLSTLAKAEPLSQMNESNASLTEPVAATVAKVIENEDPSFLTTTQSKEDLALIKEKPASVAAIAAAKKVAKAAPLPPAPKAKVIAKNSVRNNAKNNKIVKPVAKRDLKRLSKSGYAVQLATFTRQRNADSLISKLKGKGYTATYNKVKTSEGTVFKVIVGQVNKKEQARVLQQRLASAVQIRGFIVTTGQG